jgi:hypothetical protein
MRKKHMTNLNVVDVKDDRLFSQLKIILEALGFDHI